ncbi:MAG: TIGR02597 family protein [Chthoniobacterales bacterium]
MTKPFVKKLPKYSVLAAALLAFGMSFSQAQTTISSAPEGFMNFVIPAGSLVTPSVYMFSLPLTAAPPTNLVGQTAGRITGVTAATITNSSAGWTAGALSQAATPYFIRITSGTAIGRTLAISTTAANTVTVVTVDNQGTPLNGLGIVAGDSYEIFPADTLSSLFGSAVLGGTSTADADVVRLQNGANWLEYYYDTGAAQWRLNSIATSQNNVIIRPDAGIIFYRRGATPLTLTLTGRVPTTDLQTVVNEVGPTFVGGFPVDTPLGQSDFRMMPTWINNTGNAATADKINVFLSGVWNSYNYNQTAGQWRNGSVPVNMDSLVTIPAGTPVIIDSPTGSPGLKVWKRTLPYSL